MAKPYHKNPRRITAKQYEALAIDLAELGDLGGIVHDLNSDEIIGGNQRGRVFDLNACDVVLTEVLPEPDTQGTVAHGYVIWKGAKYAYRQVRWTARQCDRANIVANKRGGTWDFDILADQFEQDDLLAWGFEPFELGIDETEAKGGADTEPQTDRAEELRQLWGTAPGQLWELGAHRLLCASCLEPESISRLLGGETPAMIFADPPYGVNIVAANGYVGGGEGPNGLIPFGGVRNRKKGFVGGGEGDSLRHGHYAIEETKKSKGLGSSNGAKPFGSKDVRGSDRAANVVDVGKYAPIIGDETTETAVRSSSALLAQFPKAVHVWWGGNYYADRLPASPCWLVWNKETTGNFADCELAWTNQQRAAKLFTHQWNGMLRDSERERRFHPTQKPAALASWVYGELGQAGDLILDPFCGSGPTIIAAEETGRRVFSLEMSEEYMAVILDRWARHTGQTPVLLEQ